MTVTGGIDTSRHNLRKIGRFVLLSGGGWVLDTALYTLLVSFSVRVLLASIAGGICGASFAFLTSSRFVFQTSGRNLPLKLTIYLVYTVIQIMLAALANEALTVALLHLAEGLQRPVSLTLAALAAKCLITPFLLLMNFFVARSVLQRN